MVIYELIEGYAADCTHEVISGIVGRIDMEQLKNGASRNQEVGRLPNVDLAEVDQQRHLKNGSLKRSNGELLKLGTKTSPEDIISFESPGSTTPDEDDLPENKDFKNTYRENWHSLCEHYSSKNVQKQYHTHQTTPPESGTTWYYAVFLVVNASLGACLLNFPHAYNQAGGIAVAVVIQAILIGFVLVSHLILAVCSDLNNSRTYQDVVLVLCGKRVHQACVFLLILYCYGSCTTFLILIGDQFERALSSLYGSDFCYYWYMNRTFTITASAVTLVLPLCFPARIDWLKYPSSFGVLSILYVVFLIVYQYFTEDFEKGIIKTRPDNWTDMFYVVPVVCFGFQCHITIIPIYSCLQPRTIPAFSKTILSATLVSLIVYTTAATFGYLTFGSLVPSDIIEAYDATDPIVLTGLIAFSLKCITTYPILLFCGRAAVDGMIVDLLHLTDASVVNGERRRRIFIGLAWFSTSVCVSVFVPSISDVISLLGSLSAVFVFIFPGWCLIKATLLQDRNLEHIKSRLIVCTAIIFITIGTLLFLVVVIQAVQMIVMGREEEKSLCV